MPQISRIRIVNCNYNDGNRLIPDELYDLESPDSGEALNSLFNLNNGGGKTVLIQLIMQPVNPKAMAGGRHIEDYFTHPKDHSYILIEWNKDGSKEKLLTGIAIAASQSTVDDNSRGNAIKYYTFKTEYTDYSPYSIEKLDLSRSENGRFVTETFEYVREKAKTSKGVLEYYSSDDSVKWTELLSNYGIYKSEWESVIETLNKDEGGLNQYFDDARTSDKLISKFFIPAIEQKMKSASSKGTDSSLETMLINYAKKILDKDAVIQERKTNGRLLESLSELERKSEELYSTNDFLNGCIAEAYGFKAALIDRNIQIESELSDIERRINDLNNKVRHIEYEEKSQEYYLASEKYEEVSEEFEKAKSILTAINDKVNELRHRDELLQCARLLNEITETEGKITAYQNQIRERENDSEDARTIGILKYSAVQKVKQAKAEAEAVFDEKNRQRVAEDIRKKETEQTKQTTEDKYHKAEEKYRDTEASLNAEKRMTDQLIKRLQLSVIRQFDGFYSDAEIDEAREIKQNEKRSKDDEIININGELKQIEHEINEIPDQIIKLVREKDSVTSQAGQVEASISDYDELLVQITSVCEKYSMEVAEALSGHLSKVVSDESALTEARIKKAKDVEVELQKRLQAAKRGYVHILPRIMDYIVATGIHCQTGEEYLCSLLEAGHLTRQKGNDILEHYPELAYAVLFDHEADLHKLLNAGNIEWIPAAVPLLTMSQVDAILRGEENRYTFLAVYDKEYFQDRNGFIDRIGESIRENDELLHRLNNYREEIKADQELVGRFQYPIDFSIVQNRKLTQLRDEIKRLDRELNELEIKKLTLQQEKESLFEKNNNNRQESNNIKKWLEDCSDLLLSMDKETKTYEKSQTVYIEMGNLRAEYGRTVKDYERICEMITGLESEIEGQRVLLQELTETAKVLGDAPQTEVMDGEWRNLYSQYTALYQNMNSDLGKLREQLNTEIANNEERNEELLGLHCEESEYSKVVFTVPILNETRKQYNSAEEERKKCQGIYNECNDRYIKLQGRLDFAKDALDEFDAVPLPRNEIGSDFKARRIDAQKSVSGLEKDRKKTENTKGYTQNMIAQVGNTLEDYAFFGNSTVVVLQTELDEQWKTMRSCLSESKEQYNKQKSKLHQGINETISNFSTKVLAEIIGKLSAIGDMLENVEMKGDRLFTVNESIDTMIQSIEKINSKIETDLKEIDNEFNDIVNQCMNQGKRMYNDLRIIANSSRAHVFEGKPQIQMVKMNIPEEKEISEEASRVAIKSEIEFGANELKKMLQEEADIKAIQKRAKIIMSSERMLHKYIRQESIQVKVYKIDLNSENSVYKRWEDTLTQNSGAEKFVVFFSVVLTLMNYTRLSAGIVDKNVKSVLVLDNPFGKITSAHLLKPMFDIAKHFSVQLICLSDINKSDVINCFDNVIKLVVKEQNLSNRAIMTHEGNERIEHGYYKIMNRQMSLF